MNDQHLKEIKNYRLYGLHSCIEELLSDIGYFCHFCIQLILELGYSTTKAATNGVEWPKQRLLDSMSDCESLFKSANMWLEGSEWETVLLGWALYIDGLDDVLKLVVLQTNPTDNLEEKLGLPRVLERNLPLIRLLIPIVKLSRVFFRRFFKFGSHGQPLPPFTEMCSRQLHSLHSLPVSVADRLNILHTMLTNSSIYGEDFIESFVERVRSLLGLFQSSFLDLILGIIPPDNDNYKACFFTWNTQLIIATQNIIELALSYSDNPTYV
ncbi:hypothetical protein PGT21_027383 [Puccinia graminis f. sp. tritici]|nr:hypothetical protein PGT21_027383 [Puccinia graminis f. sp. tritici]